MLILLGPGIHIIAEVSEDITTGVEINLSDTMIRSGRFRLTRKGERTWGSGKTKYPYFTYERVGDILEDEKSVPHNVLNV